MEKEEKVQQYKLAAEGLGRRIWGFRFQEFRARATGLATPNLVSLRTHKAAAVS